MRAVDARKINYICTMTKQLTAEELETIQNLHRAFTQSKIALGDIELTKQDLLVEIANLKKEFVANEKSLIEKYGADAVINVKTGEITNGKN
jgi:soluble P-type ATPase